MLPLAGFAGNAFRLAFTGNLLIELIDDPLQLLSAIQWVFVGFRHIASVDFRSFGRCLPSTRGSGYPIPCRALGNPEHGVELAERGIAINAIAPGGTATDMAAKVGHL